ncbi:MAG TPA: dihydroorotate dehydrogenase, partial [Candidatus Limnocylindrales bacterium]
MKAKRRVVTSGGAPAKRRPTVRRIKPAIAPLQRRDGPTGGQLPISAATSGRDGSVSLAPRPEPQLPAGATTDIDLSVDLGRGLVLRNPLLVASGTFGYGTEYADVVDVQRLGAICCKGTTLKPRIGNPTPRVTETPGGMLNSIGLQNPGVDAVIEKYASLWQEWSVPVIVNVAGHSVAEYVECAKRLDGVPGVAGIELNISCPNVSSGLQIGADPSATREVLAACREATSRFLIAKLTPNVRDVTEIGAAALEAGANGLSLVNTFKALVLDRQTLRPFLGNRTGGLCGPAI